MDNVSHARGFLSTDPEHEKQREDAMGDAVSAAREVAGCAHEVTEMAKMQPMMLWCACCGAIRVDGHWRLPSKVKTLQAHVRRAQELL